MAVHLLNGETNDLEEFFDKKFVNVITIVPSHYNWRLANSAVSLHTGPELAIGKQNIFGRKSCVSAELPA
jgi:hypothetical protein